MEIQKWWFFATPYYVYQFLRKFKEYRFFFFNSPNSVAVSLQNMAPGAQGNTAGALLDFENRTNKKMSKDAGLGFG